MNKKTLTILFSLLFMIFGCELQKEVEPSQANSSNIINKGPIYTEVNSFTHSGISNKLFPGFYYTVEKASKQKLQLGERGLIDADYRFWDPSKCYLDYNQDGLMDMFAFLTNFKDPPYGSNFGKFLLVDDVFGPSPKLKFIDANRRFLPRLKTMDLNKDGVFEVLFSAEEDHLLINGTHGKPAPVQFVQISKNGDLVFKEIGEPVSIHGQGFGDVDNDGDIDIIVWRSAYTNPDKEDLGSLPILYLNDGSNNFLKTNSFTQFKGLDTILPILPWGERKVYGATAVDLFDVDGDGFLDMLTASTHNPAPNPVPWVYHHASTRVYWGDGSGFFDVENRFTDLPVDYLQGLGIASNIGVVTLGFSYLDYDKDGDMDVITISTPDYGGFVIQLCENLGNRKFKDVTKQKFDTYSSIFQRGSQPTGVFPNFYELRVFDKDGDGDFDLVPDHVAIWSIWEFPISQNLYWENNGGNFKLKR